MEIIERIGYLQGTADALGILEGDSKEDKMFKAILTAVTEFGYALVDLQNTLSTLQEEMDAVSEDLSDVEDVVYDLDLGEDDDDDLDPFDFGLDDDEDEDLDDDDFFTVMCPKCGAEVFVDDDALAEGEVQCPECDEMIPLELSSLEPEAGGDDSEETDE